MASYSELRTLTGHGIGGTDEVTARGAALERYNAISTRMDMLEETCDDILDDANDDDEGADAEAILAAIDDRVALEMHAGITLAPVDVATPEQMSFPTGDTMLADLEARMQRLRQEP